jgi:hypothetical protein
MHEYIATDVHELDVVFSELVVQIGVYIVCHQDAFWTELPNLFYQRTCIDVLRPCFGFCFLAQKPLVR